MRRYLPCRPHRRAAELAAEDGAELLGRERVEDVAREWHLLRVVLLVEAAEVRLGEGPLGCGGSGGGGGGGVRDDSSAAVGVNGHLLRGCGAFGSG